MDSDDHNVVVEFGGSQKEEQSSGGELPGTDNLVTFVTSRNIREGEQLSEPNVFGREWIWVGLGHMTQRVSACTKCQWI